MGWLTCLLEYFTKSMQITNLIVSGNLRNPIRPPMTPKGCYITPALCKPIIKVNTR